MQPSFVEYQLPICYSDYAAKELLTMGAVFCIAAGFALLVAGAFFWIFRLMIASGERAASDVTALGRFSIEKYRAMQRLLDEEDFEFLWSQPGISPRVAVRFRVGRRRILRLYLADLSRDFKSIYAVAKLCLLHSAEDNPALALALLRQKWTFNYAIALVRVRLMLQPFGLGRLDTRILVDTVDAMYGRLRQSNVVLLTCSANTLPFRTS
jgi:hypothetical protein